MKTARCATTFALGLLLSGGLSAHTLPAAETAAARPKIVVKAAAPLGAVVQSVNWRRGRGYYRAYRPNYNYGYRPYYYNYGYRPYYYGRPNYYYGNYNGSYYYPNYGYSYGYGPAWGYRGW